MKTRILNIALMAFVIFSSCSCHKESAMSHGELVDVILDTQIPGDPERKSGEALEIDKVYYEIWNQDYSKVISKGSEDVSDRTASIDLKLLRNQTYNIILWAQSSSCLAYSWNDLKEINISYVDDGYDHAIGNNEHRDAFYAVSQISTHNMISKYIPLERPFTQVNFYADDLSDSEALKHEISIEGLSEVFDTIAGEGKASDGDVFTFAAEGVVAEEQITHEGVRYDHVAMNYVLVPGKETKLHIEAEFMAVRNGKDVSSTFEMKSVSAGSNEKVNFYGSLLTDI